MTIIFWKDHIYYLFNSAALHLFYWKLILNNFLFIIVFPIVGPKKAHTVKPQIQNIHDNIRHGNIWNEGDCVVSRTNLSG